MLNCAIMDIFTDADKLNFSYGPLINCVNMDIFQNTDKLYHYGMLINCAIMDIFTNIVPLWDTNKLCNYGYVYEYYAVFVILMTHRDSSATRIFTKFGNVYEQLDNMHINVPEHSYQNDKYSYEFHCII